jgi:hypothetical protein
MGVGFQSQGVCVCFFIRSNDTGGPPANRVWNVVLARGIRGLAWLVLLVGRFANPLARPLLIRFFFNDENWRDSHPYSDLLKRRQAVQYR